MATQNKTGTTVTSGVPSINDRGGYEDGASSYVLKQTVDLSGSTQDADAEIYQCLAIPADTLVTNVWVKIVTAAAASTSNFTIGDGADPNGWHAGVDMTATAGTVTYGVVGTDAYLADDSATAQGKFYTAADTIDAVIEGTSTQDGNGPKFEIYAHCININ